MEGIRVPRLRGLGIVGRSSVGSSVFSSWEKTCNASAACAEASVGMLTSSSSDLSPSEGSLCSSRTSMFSGSLVVSRAPSIGPQSDRGVAHSVLVISNDPPATSHAKYLWSLMRMFIHARNSKLNLTCFHPLSS